MKIQKSVTWPSEKECHQLNKIIFETSRHPFGIAQYNRHERVSDFVGRKKERAKFKEYIKIVFNKKMSRAVRLEGPDGVGKSTLFNFLKEQIEKERSEEDPSTDYILKGSTIYSTYFPVPDKFKEFSDIWRPILDGLRAGFELEVGEDISLPEYVAFRFIYKMFLFDKEALAKIIWRDERRPKNLHHVDYKDIIQPLLAQGTIAVQSIQAYFSEKKRELREYFKVYIREHTYEIKREDNKTILNLFRVIDEDDPEDFLELILDGSPNLFKTNDDLIDYFNKLMRYLACSTETQPILLIGIDEIVKASEATLSIYCKDLGKLFIKLREQLDYILFVFISTTTDWEHFDNILGKETDLKGQLDEFLFKMPLVQLEVDKVIQVFKKRMNRFWEQYPGQQHHLALYYPFSENLFEYAYRYRQRDLRRTIHFLNDLWMNFRFHTSIPKLDTMFECMREVRTFDDQPFEPNKLRSFEWKIIYQSFNDPARFNSNSARSSAVEVGLENAWRCFYHEEPRTVTDVRNNPQIKTSKGIRKPDVFVEILGNLGAEFRRKFEFQVKAYSSKGKIPYKKIKSSLKLFKDNYTDFIYFIITGQGFDSTAEAKVKELETKYPNRIRRPSLSEPQESRLYLLALYEEITGSKLGSNRSKDLHIAKNLISSIIGQSVESFLTEIKNLVFRKTQIAIEPEIIEPEIIIQEGEIQTHKDIISFTNGHTPEAINEELFSTQTKIISTEEKKPPLPQWLTLNPEFKPFRYEICALCRYFKDFNREKGSDKFKFYPPTIQRNIIDGDATLDNTVFRELVEFMKKKGFINTEKRSFRLTEKGETLYYTVKKEDYKVHI